MADQLQLRGGTTAQHATFTGALREVTVDTDKKTVVVHDGSTAGGNPLLRQDLSNLPAGTIDNADINASAGIVDTKLATIATVGKVSNSATTATNANTASAIVARDGSGNFTAGTITAALTGAASSNVLKAGDTMTGNLTVPSLNGGPLAGTRNRIINGNFDFWQRGTSTTATGNTYLADRWLSSYSTGGTVSQETSSLPTGSRYAWKFVASASNSFLQMGQQIEYGNCIDFQNTTVTISFMARAVTATAGSTALIFRTRTIAGVDGVCVFTGTNVDSALTLTTSWTRYTVTRTLPATFGSLSLEFVLGSHVSGDGIMLAQVQIEPGTVATPFERRSYGQELALCQRYFEAGNGDCVSYAASGAAIQRFTQNFVVLKRTTATVAISKISGDATSIAVSSVFGNLNGFSYNIVSTSSSETLQSYWTASAEL
jgi:hypothetical protein